MATLMKSKRDEAATITLCKLKLKKYILYLTLSILSTKSHAKQKPKYPSEMS
jgi:hypothetical protein